MRIFSAFLISLSLLGSLATKANGRALDNLGVTGDGAGVSQWTAAGNFSWNQHWTFMHALPQLLPPAGVISQGRPVASSSTENNNYDFKGNNGVAGDRWTASDGSYPQWWRVDTGLVQPITKVEIDWFPDGGRTYQYQIEVSDNDFNWTVAAVRTNNAVSGTTVDTFAATGRFVRVMITGGSAGFAAFHECRVCNEAQPMRNLSQFRPTSASSEQTGNLAVNANDVDAVWTRWCASSSSYPAWWQVDLGTAQQVNKAVITWFDDDARYYQYKVEGSTDGTSFTTLIDRTSNTTPYTTADTFSGVARFVRVTVTGSSAGWPSFYDAQIYGATAPLPPLAPVLTATPTGAQINLSWPAVGGATSYTVKRALVSGGPYETLTTTTGTSYSDTAVVAGIPYFYVVSATNNIGTSANSAEVAVAVNGELRAYLPFDETNGTVAADASGFGRNGTLVNGPLWAAGNAGNAVDLDGTDDFVALPSGVVNTLTNFTIAAWVNPDAISTWARLFDFGTGTDNYMFLALSNGSAIRFAIRTPAVAEQVLTGSAPLAAGVWSHVAVTLSLNTATLYVNGTAVATNNAMTLRPSSLGNTTNNWIGRSQFADPYLNGRVDDFRIYNRALTVAELGKLRGVTAPAAPANLIAQAGNTQATLAWPPSLGATSYKVQRSTTSGGPYALVATVNAGSYTNTGLTNGTPYYYVVSALNAANESANSPQVAVTPVATAPAGPAAPVVLYPYEVGTQVKLAWTASPGAGTYQLKRSTVNAGPYTIIATGAGTTATDSAVTLGTTYYYVVSATTGGVEGANSTQASATPTAAVATAYLKMDEASGTTTADSSGNGWTGTLVNGPTRVAGKLDRAINFDGSNDHITLPAGVVSALNDCTFSAWVKVSALSTWSRVFDFGTGTDNYLFLTLQSGSGKPQFTILAPGVGGQDIVSSSTIPLNAWTHIAVTLSGTTGTFYINGVAVAANGAMTLKPSDLGSTNLNYLGRSQYPDPYFAGQIDEFQIRNRALTATEVATLAAPPNAPIGLTPTAGASQVSLSWAAAAGATGYNVKRATVNGGPYATVASDVTPTNYTDTGLTPGTAYYYVVTTAKYVAESANSAQVNSMPLTDLQAWRLANFGTTSNTGNAADGADPDGDGMTNLEEFSAGTNPKNGGSFFKITALQISGNDLVITFPTVTGKSYTVEYSDTLGVGTWTVVQTAGGPAENIAGNGNAAQIADQNGALQPKRFYRVEVVSP